MYGIPQSTTNQKRVLQGNPTVHAPSRSGSTSAVNRLFKIPYDTRQATPAENTNPWRTAEPACELNVPRHAARQNTQTLALMKLTKRDCNRENSSHRNTTRCRTRHQRSSGSVRSGPCCTAHSGDRLSNGRVPNRQPIRKRDTTSRTTSRMHPRR